MSDVWNLKRIVIIGIAGLTLLFCLALAIEIINAKPPNSTNSASSVIHLEHSIYYISNSGLDSNDGLSQSTPIKTIKKANTLALKPGDSILFKRGDVWRSTSDAYIIVKSGSQSGYITYGAYGTGAKPLILGSYSANSQSDWTSAGANIWKTTFTVAGDAGNIIFNNETSWAHNKLSSTTNLKTQSDFFWNKTDKKVYMYSTSNPALIYSNIEIASQRAYDENLIQFNKKRYVIFENLRLKYGSLGAFGGNDHVDHVVIRNNEVSWFGGAFESRTFESGNLRYGNCIGTGLGATNIIVTENIVSQCFDACLSVQSWSSAGARSIINHKWSYNIATHCRYGFEYFNSRNSGAVTRNVIVDHNTFAFNGAGWSRQFTGGDSGRIRLSQSPAGTKDFNFTNNIIYHPTYVNLEVGGGVANAWDGAQLYSDYNLYYGKGASGLINWLAVRYQNLSSFKSANGNNGNESHSLEANPLFVNPASKNYFIQSGSPACTMSSTKSFVGALPCLEPQ